MIYSICCVTRDCEFIDQFIEHHLNLGFNRITIYDNMSINPVKYDDDRVIIKLYDGFYGAGYIPYNEHAQQYKNENGWCAYIDEDEFIFTNGKSIQEAMEKYQNYDALALDWLIFGDKVDEGNTSEKLTEKYLYHVPFYWKDPSGRNYVKTIVKNENVVKFIDPHYAILEKGKINKGINGNRVMGSVNSFKDVSSGFHINHYYFRGLEAYVKRQTRPIAGRASRTVKDATDMYNSCIELITQKRTGW